MTTSFEQLSPGFFFRGLLSQSYRKLDITRESVVELMFLSFLISFKFSLVYKLTQIHNIQHFFSDVSVTELLKLYNRQTFFGSLFLV